MCRALILERDAGTSIDSKMQHEVSFKVLMYTLNSTHQLALYLEVTSGIVELGWINGIRPKILEYIVPATPRGDYLHICIGKIGQVLTHSC